MSSWKTKFAFKWSADEFSSFILDNTDGKIPPRIRKKMLVAIKNDNDLCKRGKAIKLFFKDDDYLDESFCGIDQTYIGAIVEAFDAHTTNMVNKEAGAMGEHLERLEETDDTFSVILSDSVNSMYTIEKVRPEMTVKELKRMIEQDLEFKGISLTFGSKLTDEKTVANCNIRADSVLNLTYKSVGGTTDPNSNSGSKKKRRQRKGKERHRINWRRNRHLKKCITEKGDCLFGYTRSEGYDVVEMPCTHAMESQAMFLYIKSIFAKHNSTIKILCPMPKCKLEWDWQTCCEVAGMSGEEYFSLSTVFNNRARNDIRECPNCHRINERKPGVAIMRVKCPCAGPDWCWLCAKPWRGSGLMVCGETECTKKIHILNDTLASCESSVPMGWDNKVELPNIRACPHCLVFMEKDGACKHMTCRGCLTKFCFSCLAIGTKDDYPKCSVYDTDTNTNTQDRHYKGLCKPHGIQHFH